MAHSTESESEDELELLEYDPPTKREKQLQREADEWREQVRRSQQTRLDTLRAEQKGETVTSEADRLFQLIEQVLVYTNASHTTKSAREKAGTLRRSDSLRRRAGSGDDGVEQTTEAISLTVTPKYLGGELRPYQLEGVRWLLRGFDQCVNLVLADEMGLGKTFQTIALLAFLRFTRGIRGPHLVIVPLSVLGNWGKEFAKWCPDMKVFLYRALKDTRTGMRNELLAGQYDVVVTTYENALKERAFRRIQWTYVIVDEAHRLKNENSLLTQAVKCLRSHYRLLITGTPLQNNLRELWALLNFLLPRLFDKSADFSKWFDAADATRHQNVITEIHRMLHPFMLRRLKVDADKSIPPKKEVVVMCPTVPMQRQWYTDIYTKEAAIINQATGTKTRLQNIIMQLRKVCNHPYLFPGAEEGPPFITDESLVQHSGKMRVLDLLLPKLKAEGHRVLLFCQMTRMLDIIEDYLEWRGYTYCRLDGSTSPQLRDERMDLYNAPDSEYFIFILSTRAGGLGINLHTADTVILYDSDWNPQSDLQAQDRAHRIGQKKPVTVLRLLCQKTVEERIYQRAMRKLYLDAAVIQQGRLQQANQQLQKEELLAMVKFGAEEMFKVKNEEVTIDDIDLLLSQGEEATRELEADFKKDCQLSLANFAVGIQDANQYHFEGLKDVSQATRMIILRGLNQATEDEVRGILDTGEDSMLTSVIVHPDRTTVLLHVQSVKSAGPVFAALGELTDWNGKPFTFTYVSKVSTAAVAPELFESLAERSHARGVYYAERRREENAPKMPKAPQMGNFWQLADLRTLKRLHDVQCKWIMAEHMRQVEEEEEELKQELDQRRKGITADPASPKSPKHREIYHAIVHAHVKSNGKLNLNSLVGDEAALQQAALKDDQREELRAATEGVFTAWDREDYRRFVNYSVVYGRTNVEAIAEKITSKSLEEVRRYSDAFWEKGPRCMPETEWSKSSKRILLAEERRQAEHARNKGVQSWYKAQEKWPYVEVPKITNWQQWSEPVEKAMVLAAITAEFDVSTATSTVLADQRFRFHVYLQTREREQVEKRVNTLLDAVAEVGQKRSAKVLESDESSDEAKGSRKSTKRRRVDSE